MNDRTWVIQFRDGSFLRRADYPTPCRVSTHDMRDAQHFAADSARRYVEGCASARMNYYHGVRMIQATK